MGRWLARVSWRTLIIILGVLIAAKFLFEAAGW